VTGDSTLFSAAVTDAAATPLGSHIGIGICTARAPLNRLPGWSVGSFGYYGEDGLHFAGSGAGVPYGPPFTRQDGDVIGCIVNYLDRTLSYTRNGALIGVAVTNLSIEESLYPAVGMRTPGEVIEANFGEEPFRYDIETLVQSVKSATEASISKGPHASLDRSASAQLVLDYLVHHGYKEAAVAFAASSGVEELTMAKQAGMGARQGVSALVREGRIEEAITRVNELYPTLFEDSPECLFQLKCQRFVELVREGSLEESITFGRRELQEPPEREAAALKDALALLAYPDPATSPVAHVLLPARRHAVAETLNEALLEQQREPKESRLRRLCKHALLVGEELEANEIPGARLIDLPGRVRGQQPRGRDEDGTQESLCGLADVTDGRQPPPISMEIDAGAPR